MDPKPSLAELRQDATDDAKMESAGEARSEATMMQAYPKSVPAQSAGSILRDAMEETKAIIEGEERPTPGPPRSSKDVDAMPDGSFEKVEEDVVMVTEEDYNMAEQVATQHKNEEDTASLELAGQTTEDFAFPTEASHLDVQKCLAELEEALAKLWARPGGLLQDQEHGDGVASGGGAHQEQASQLHHCGALWPGVNLQGGDILVGLYLPQDPGRVCPGPDPGSGPCEEARHLGVAQAGPWGRALRHGAACKAPWINKQEEGKCLGCGRQSSSMPALEATGLQLKVGTS